MVQQIIRNCSIPIALFYPHCEERLPKKQSHRRKQNEALNSIRVVGARTHNLQDISIDIPHNKLTVLTGVSGSGKSSLAFDTLYAEGQRQYIESLSTYARQFLNQMQRADLDSIDGLQPTLCIDQRVGVANPRSTVATVTEVYDYLRLLIARTGIPHCFSCGAAIEQQSSGQILDRLLGLPPGTKLIVMAPVVRGRKGAHRNAIAEIQKAGLVSVRVDGEQVDADAIPNLAVSQNHTIEAVVDKVVVKPENAQRLADSIGVALELADGLTSARFLTPAAKAADQEWEEELFSTRYACAGCGSSFEEIEPRTFSFNSPYGACPDCDGIGYQRSADDKEIQHASTYRDSAQCPTCDGTRLRKEALSILLDEMTIHEITSKSIADVTHWIEALEFGVDKEPVARPILNEMLHRLRFLVKVGVGYLTLGRPADTLSGGELQRVRLATCIGSGLVGVCYILDEPSIGLHQRDNDRLIESLRKLQRQDNTVIVVEHDESMMLSADRLIDMGPGAGKAGGNIVVEGTPKKVLSHKKSLTAAFLRGDRTVSPGKPRRKINKKRQLRLRGASLHNLQKIDIEIPLGLMVGVTGVSGSGKSSLISQTLIPALARQLGSKTARPGPYKTLSGSKNVDKLIEITQQPIGRTPRSTPATYCGVFDLIRAVWANTRESKQRGYGVSRFSFNAGQGRCSHCQGQGQERIEMNFLPDLFVTCSMCNGLRYNRQTLNVRYRDRTIADVLEMSVDEAVGFFENFTKISRLLQSLQSVGLGYLALGQSSATLSGGEAQRIKLATELARAETASAVYFLDEPTTGLHFEDVRRLVNVLDSLVEKGNTVVVIEHNLDVIRACDWLVDIGPEGGDAGGRLVASGPPEQIATVDESITGRYLS